MRASMFICLLMGVSLAPGAAPPQQTGRIAELVRQLGDDEFERREAASKELEAIGEPALAALRTAASSDDLEVRQRAGRYVQVIARRVLEVAARKEIAGLQGTWYSTWTESNGARITGENKADRHIFQGDRWAAEYRNTVVQTGTVKVIEVSEKLVKVDFLITDGYRKGDTWLGAYQRQGDELKSAGVYASEGKVRPTVVATRPGDGYYLRSLKRQK